MVFITLLYLWPIYMLNSNHYCSSLNGVAVHWPVTPLCQSPSVSSQYLAQCPQYQPSSLDPVWGEYDWTTAWIWVAVCLIHFHRRLQTRAAARARTSPPSTLASINCDLVFLVQWVICPGKRSGLQPSMYTLSMKCLRFDGWNAMHTYSLWRCIKALLPLFCY